MDPTLQETSSSTPSAAASSIRESWTKHFLQAPAFAFYLIFSIFPLLFTLYLSLNNWQISGQHFFVGVGNYVQLAFDPAFLTSLRNTAVFVIVPVALEYAFGMVLALFVFKLTLGRNLVRLFVLLPMMVTPLVVGVIWKMMFDETYGPLNDFIYRVGFHAGIPWLTNPSVATLSVIVADVWEWTPFMFLLLFAALQSLPGEIFESALVDGADGWQVFWDMIFPLLVPASVTAILIRSIEAFKIFDVIFLLTGGGPGSATESATLYAYDTGLRAGNIGYAAAITIVMLALVVVLVTILLNVLKLVTSHHTAKASMQARVESRIATVGLANEKSQLHALHESLTGDQTTIPASSSAKGKLVAQARSDIRWRTVGLPRLFACLRYIVLVCWFCFALFPLYWMATTAFKTHLAIYNGPFYIPGIDFKLYLGSWQYLFAGDARGAVIQGVFNSVLYATLGALFSVIAGALAGYGLARYKYSYGPLKNDDLSFLYLSQRIMPPIVAVLGLFLMYKFLNLIDAQVGMIIAYTWFNIPITAYVLKDFIGGIPRELEEAAAVDGYGKISQIRKIILPLAMPGMAAAFLLAFFFAWNDFLLALILTFQKATTLPIVITNLNERMEPEWGFLSALGVIAIVPPILATLILDRIIRKGGLFAAAR